MALTFAVLGLTGSGTDLGLVLAAQSLPLAALALVGGVWADRLPRAALMVASDLVRAAVQITAAVLLLTGAAQIWQLAILAAIHGAAEAFFRPAAGAICRRSCRRRSPAGQRPHGHERQLRLDGRPAVAGTLVAVIGAGGAIAVDGATFSSAPRSWPPCASRPCCKIAAVKNFLGELRAGWQEVKSRTWLWVMLLRACLVLCIVVAPFQVLGPLGLPRRATRRRGLGLVQAVFSAGMLGGAASHCVTGPPPIVLVCLTGSTAVAAPLALALGGSHLPSGSSTACAASAWASSWRYGTRRCRPRSRARPWAA